MCIRDRKNSHQKVSSLAFSKNPKNNNYLTEDLNGLKNHSSQKFFFVFGIALLTAFLSSIIIFGIKKISSQES